MDGEKEINVKDVAKAIGPIIDGVVIRHMATLRNNSRKDCLKIVLGVINSLPKNVNKFVRNYIEVDIANCSYYHHLYTNRRGRIVLRFEHTDTKKRMETLVAHEIAHAWLLRNDPYARGGSKAERAADDLCEKWGYGRCYKSYKMFEDLEAEREELLKKMEKTDYE